MYNIIQLNDKDLSELQSIAKELGIKKTESFKKEDLVYKILDEQAIAGATKKVAAEKANESQPRKRSRINKKEGDKVYTATKDKAQKLEANTPQPAAVAEVVKESEATTVPAQTEAVTEKSTEEKAPKKRGRKPGSKKNAIKTEEKQSETSIKEAVKEEEVKVETKQTVKATGNFSGFVLFFFKTGSLCSLDCSGTHYVDQVGQELNRYQSVSTFLML